MSVPRGQDTILLRRLRFAAGALLCLSLQGCAADVELDDWSQTGNAQWRFSGRSVEAGPAEATGHLVSTEQYRDVTITVEFWIADETNSGIFVRCEDPGTITADNCYEVNIWDNHPQQDYRTGSIVKRQAPLAHVETLDRWNRCRIDLRGSTITVTMNDIVTARFEDNSLDRGHIALQYFGSGALRFRNMQIRTR